MVLYRHGDGAAHNASQQPCDLSLSHPHTLRYAYICSWEKKAKASWVYRLGIVRDTQNAEPALFVGWPSSFVTASLCLLSITEAEISFFPYLQGKSVR